MNTKQPAASCCPPGSIGPATVRSDRPLQGHMVEIPPPFSAESASTLPGMLSMPCYITGAPLSTASSVVVIFTDVYGIESGHHKVFADCLAEQMTAQNTKEKVAVIIPDLQRGTPILQPWINDMNSFAKDMFGSLLGSAGMMVRIKRDYPPQKIEQEIFQMILPYIQDQSKLANVKLSCVGFCFGGWVVGRVLGYPGNNNDKSDDAEDNHDANSSPPLMFQCGVGIHPSFQPNLAHGEFQTTMAERIDKPMLLLPAWNDVDLKPGTKIVDIMTANQIKNNQTDTESPPVVSIEFESMVHGWVTRGDPTDPKVAAEQARALELTVDFLQKHTSS